MRAGELVFGTSGLRLESGAPRGGLSAQILRYADLVGVEMARHPEERIHGRPTAIVRRSGRAPLAIAAVDGLGSVYELAERLAAAISGTIPA